MHLHDIYSCAVVLFMLLGIRLHIMCPTPSTWKVRSGEMVKRGLAALCLSCSLVKKKVNRSDDDTQVVSCHHYLVVFHLFVEQLVSCLLLISTLVCMHNLCNLKIGHYTVA